MIMLDEIAKILSEQLGIPQSKVTLESRIVEDLGADSLDVVELLMQLEDNTGKTIPDDKVASINTVGDLIKTLETLYFYLINLRAEHILCSAHFFILKF